MEAVNNLLATAGQFLSTVFGWVNIFADPIRFWPGIILLAIGYFYLKTRDEDGKRSTPRVVTGISFLAVGAALTLGSIHFLSTNTVEVIVLIILLIGTIGIIASGRWWAKVIGIILFILVYVQLKEVAPVGSPVGQFLYAVENGVSYVANLFNH